jgi:hypothetical protein
MIINPHLGIGDLLILRMKEISNNLNITHININKKLIEKYSSNYNTKINFVTKFIMFLFPNVTININDNPCNFNIIDNYKLNTLYLYNYVNHNLINIENKYTDYIVFHTKMRHDNLIDKFINESLSSLNYFFETFKTSKKIIIMGEKHIGKNIETIKHKTISLYNNLLLLKKNNHVIDLTSNILTEGNPDFNSFLFDIELINKAICNITFGIGGSFNICKAFSKNNISFIPFYNLSPYNIILNEMNNIDNSIVENTDELNNKIKNITHK